MPDNSDLISPDDYRARRRAFIAACEKMGADVIGRVHPERGPDGRPLFTDSAAFGPRPAARGLLLVSGAPGSDSAQGAAAQRLLLGEDFVPPARARLVLVHALDPVLAAAGRPGGTAGWAAETLNTVIGEDLTRAGEVRVLLLGGALPPERLRAAPEARLHLETLAHGDIIAAVRAAKAAIAALEGSGV